MKSEIGFSSAIASQPLPRCFAWNWLMVVIDKLLCSIFYWVLIILRRLFRVPEAQAYVALLSPPRISRWTNIWVIVVWSQKGLRSKNKFQILQKKNSKIAKIFSCHEIESVQRTLFISNWQKRRLQHLLFMIMPTPERPVQEQPQLQHRGIRGSCTAF